MSGASHASPVADWLWKENDHDADARGRGDEL